MSKHCHLVIESIKEDGKVFRPSDWIERLSTLLATFGPDHRLHYSDRVRPSMLNGQRCLVVDQELRQENFQAYEHILSFAHSNNLRVHEEYRED